VTETDAHRQVQARRHQARRFERIIVKVRIGFLLVSMAALSACASADDVAPDQVGAEESAASVLPRAAYYRIVEVGGSLYAQLANATSTPCADGSTNVRCPLADVNFDALRLSAARKAQVVASLPQDIVLVYGTPQTATVVGKKQLRLVASRAFQNLLRVFPEGPLLEVTQLSQSTTCRLATFTPPRPGVFAAPTLSVASGTCTHAVRPLNSVRKFAVDEPDWSSRERWLPVGATEDVVADLQAGASVIANGRWESNQNAAFARPSPVQIWRDVSRIGAQ
jgi:hypothetical protein